MSWPRLSAWPRLCAAFASLALVGPVGLAGVTAAAASAAAAGPRSARLSVTAMNDISSRCGGQNAEVEEAHDGARFVYAIWIGCGGIGFARSTDGGLHFDRPIILPDSEVAQQSWDPAIAVAPSGTVYASFMHAGGFTPSAKTFPVVDASFDHGATFPQVTSVRPRTPGNWGDRDFIAVGKTGIVYLTWDYGPSSKGVMFLCDPTGSCAFSNGDFNAVMQVSRDGGRTFGPIRSMEPGFPLGGGISAPLVVSPSGRIDALYVGHPTSRKTLALHPGYEFFTSSKNGTTWPSHPFRLWPSKGTLSLPEWWIDGDISADAAGNLYATWDTQTRRGDFGWLSFSETRVVPGPVRSG